LPSTGTQSAGLGAVLEGVPVDVAALDQMRDLLLALEDHAEIGLVRGLLDGAVQQRLVGTTRPGSIPQEAAMIALGVASSMRTASSCAAKPPKTTEWIAPSRAQASIASAPRGPSACR
jgi:hypothetical protein